MAGINRRDKGNKPPFNLSVEDAETQTRGAMIGWDSARGDIEA